jgi:hypothetical protein
MHFDVRPISPSSQERSYLPDKIIWIFVFAGTLRRTAACIPETPAPCQHRRQNKDHYGTTDRNPRHLERKRGGRPSLD